MLFWKETRKAENQIKNLKKIKAVFIQYLIGGESVQRYGICPYLLLKFTNMYQKVIKSALVLSVNISSKTAWELSTKWF